MNRVGQGAYRQKVCPRCGRTFLCGHDLPEMLCDCKQVVLQEHHRIYLAAHYSDCLCLPCLREIAARSSEELTTVQS